MAAEEEFFLVLDGEGACLLGDEEHPVRPGSIVGRPPGTGVAHAFRGPLTLLTYGTNEPNEICYYPRSNKIAFCGVDAHHRPNPELDYWDEPVPLSRPVRCQAPDMSSWNAIDQRRRPRSGRRP